MPGEEVAGAVAQPAAGPTPGSEDGLLARTGLDGVQVLLPVALLVLGLGLALHTLVQPTVRTP